LIAQNPRSARRSLKRIDKDGVLELNESMFVFLSFITNAILKRNDKNQALMPKISSLDLKKAQKIININKY
jgi:hypothetical protein